jgi:hypothetical protein
VARNDQFPRDPKLPQLQTDPIAWLTELSVRLQQFMMALISTLNLLIQGYQFTSTTLVGSTFAPTATTRNRVLVVNGVGAVPDRIYLCNWDGTAYVWSKFLLYESTTFNWTPGVINNGASVSINVNVSNLQAAFLCIAGLTPNLPAGMAVFATVISSTQVNVILYNLSGAQQNIGSSVGTIYMIQ